MLIDFINHFLIPCLPLFGMLLFNNCCCEESCTFFTDNFNRADDDDPGAYTEVSGDWDIASNRLTTSNSNGLLIADTEHPDGEPNIRIAVTVNIANSGNIARFILDYVDSSNYWFFELQAGSGAWRLIRRSGGSNTTIAINSLSTATNSDISICVSIRGGNISGIAAGSSTLTAAGSFSSPKWGLGTGTTVTGQIRFDDLTVSRTNEDCPPCAGCSACGNGLPEDLPQELQFEVFGIASPLTHLNGSWTAAFKSCDGSGARWETRYTDRYLSTCGESPGTTQEVVAIVDVIYSPSLDTLALSCTLTNDLGAGIAWSAEFSMENPPDCLSFDEELLDTEEPDGCAFVPALGSYALLSTP